VGAAGFEAEDGGAQPRSFALGGALVRAHPVAAQSTVSARQRSPCATCDPAGGAALAASALPDAGPAWAEACARAAVKAIDAGDADGARRLLWDALRALAPGGAQPFRIVAGGRS
jgi:hypothetical protein